MMRSWKNDGSVRISSIPTLVLVPMAFLLGWSLCALHMMSHGASNSCSCPVALSKPFRVEAVIPSPDCPVQRPCAACAPCPACPIDQVSSVSSPAGPVQPAESFNCSACPAPPPDPETHESLYGKMRSVWRYESPLPKPYDDIPETVRAKFARIPSLFNFNVPRHISMWQRFKAQCDLDLLPRGVKEGTNTMYPNLDSTFLLCWLRENKPNRLVEIGSGESTHVAVAALKANAMEGVPVNHTCIEPYRANAVPPSVYTIQKEVQEVDYEIFDALQAGDVLFIDSSHVSAPYGDTLYEFVTILPRLNPGVVVHIHDIHLPWDYKANWMNKNAVYTEQWLLALLLYGAENTWEVVWGTRLMQLEHRAFIQTMKGFPFSANPNGGAFWIRKLGPALREPMPSTSHYSADL